MSTKMMRINIRKATCAAILFAGMLLVDSAHAAAQISGCTIGNTGFDYFLLALQWPPAFGRLDKSHFTIHGLWPSRSGDDCATYPCDCSDEPFNASLLQPIMASMKENWPSLKGSEDASFWEHEFTKHGTCSGLKQLQYFNVTLNLRSTFNPGKGLSKLHPSKTTPYSVAQIGRVMRAALGKGILLGCREQDGRQLLSEVGLAFSRGLQLQEPSKNVKLERDEVNDCDDQRDVWIVRGASSYSRTEAITKL